MNDNATLISLISALGPNFVYNLDFIPADKFDWKPATTAKSVKEILDHLLGNFDMINGQFAEVPERQPLTDIAGAKAALQAAIETYIQNLTDATPEKLASEVKLPHFSLPLSSLTKVAVGDTINHHGQITYIQSLLGDDESHFLPDFFQKLA